MVLVMGWGEKREVLGATPDRTCERCHNTGPWVIYKSRKRLKVMFIPVAKWGEYFAAQCSICPNEVELSALDAHRLARGDITLDQVSPP